MTEDRDFKHHVRERAARTGESYQAARRQLERRRRFSARVVQQFRTPRGIALGCIIEAGQVRPGMPVTVVSDAGEPRHRAVVVSLRRWWTDLDDLRYEGEALEFGLLLDPPYTGPVPARVTG
jgi:hypothetical protein